MPDAAPAAAVSVEIDREVCIGAGMCIVYAPATFAHDGQKKAIVQALPHDPADRIRTAVDACPMGALTLRES